MANYLASIFGTEQDKVNCSFYYKIGACRHGDRCSRKHVKPSYSQTVLMPNMYQNPAYDPKSKMNPSQLQNHFDAFYEDVWCEMCKYGELEELVVCDNNNDRMFDLDFTSTFDTPFHFLHILPSLPFHYRGHLTNIFTSRPNRKRLRKIQIRRRRPGSMRQIEFSLVRRKTDIL